MAVSASAIRAGQAYVELMLKDGTFQKGLTAAQKKLHAFGTASMQIGRRMAAMTGIMAAPFIGGAKVYADFEQQMANVATMLDRPQEHMARFRRGIRELSVELGESTETLAKGLYDILSASIAPEKALQVLSVASRAAKAGLTDTGVAADAITTILNAYGLSADRAADVSDWLFAVVKRGKTTFAELAPQIGQVATTASVAGISMEEFGAAISTLTRHGVRAEITMTAVQAIISTFLKPEKQAAEYARTLGFELSSATLRAKGLAGVFEMIGHLPPDAIARLFPSIRALRGVLPAIQNLKGFKGDIELMSQRAGMAEVAYQKMANTLSTEMGRIYQSGKLVLSVIGEALAGEIASIGKHLKEWAFWTADLLGQNKELVAAAAKVVLVVGAISAGFVAAGVAGLLLSGIMGGLAAAGSVIATAFGALVAVLGALLSPIGLVSTAMIGLASYFVYASGAGGEALSWLGQRLTELGQWAKSVWRGMADALAAGDIALAAEVLWASLRVAWTAGVNWLLTKWIDFKEAFLDVWHGAVYGIADAMTGAWAGLQAGWVEAVASLEAVWVSFTSVAVDAWKSVEEAMAKGIAYLIAKMDGLDPEQVMDAVGEDYARQRRQREEETQGRLAGIEESRQQKRETIEEERKGAIAANRDRAGMEQEQRRKRFSADRRELEGELDDAKRRLAESQKAAASKRAAMEEGGAPKPASAEEAARAAAKAMEGIDFGKASEKITTKGTFSAFAALGLGTGNAADRTAKATEKTAAEVEKLNSRAARNRNALAFS